MDYVAEGGGGHHWRMVDAAGRACFATVDDLDGKEWLGAARDAVFDGLGQALATAARLRDEAGLSFVLAPTIGRHGQIVVRLGERYALSLLPFVAGRSHPFGPYPPGPLRDEALELIVAVHRATPVVRTGAPVHQPGFGGRADLEAFLADPDRRWEAGPFGPPARRLLAPRAADLTRLVARFDELVASTAPARAAAVVTHGEPHPANLLAADGHLYLIDWDTVGLGPPERDLALISGPDGWGLDLYAEATGHVPDRRVTALYRLRWYLDDIGSAVRLLSRPHGDTADTRRWAAGVETQLEELSDRLHPGSDG